MLIVLFVLICLTLIMFIVPFKKILFIFLKLAAWIIIPIALINFIFKIIKEKSARDEIAQLLIPYHNDYVLFQDYYMTIESYQSFWFFRFILFVLIPHNINRLGSRNYFKFSKIKK